MPHGRPGAAAAGRRFATTQWSLVLAARDATSPQAEEALARFCACYWPPVYAFVRSRGHAAPEAEDLTQGFFLRFLEKDYLRRVDRDKGRFRAFLLASCKHFLSNERDRERAKRRGGDQIRVSIDSTAIDWGAEPSFSHGLTPELVYERQWALNLLRHILTALHEEYAASGREAIFERLKAFLTGEDGRKDMAEAARDLGLSLGALRVALHRLRRRYRDTLRQRIGETVESPDQIDDEIRHLRTALTTPATTR